MKKISILVVEDYSDLRSLIQIFLEQIGFAVVAKENGAEALTYLNEQRPDLILTDLMMPDVSGIELIEKVRANHQLLNIPIIAMTACDREPIKKAKEAGANRVLEKPLNPEAIVSTLRELLPFATV